MVTVAVWTEKCCVRTASCPLRWWFGAVTGRFATRRAIRGRGNCCLARRPASRSAWRASWKRVLWVRVGGVRNRGKCRHASAQIRSISTAAIRVRCTVRYGNITTKPAMTSTTKHSKRIARASMTTIRVLWLSSPPLNTRTPPSCVLRTARSCATTARV